MHCRGSHCRPEHGITGCMCPCPGCLTATLAREAVAIPDTVRRVVTVAIGFSTPWDHPVPSGETFEIVRRPNRGPVRVKRLEIRPRSARGFDLVGGHVASYLLTEGGHDVCLGVLPPARVERLAPRVLELPDVTLTVGMEIKVTVRNIGAKPARFCANIIVLRED
jgi:hypothetical protein